MSRLVAACLLLLTTCLPRLVLLLAILAVLFFGRTQANSAPTPPLAPGNDGASQGSARAPSVVEAETALRAMAASHPGLPLFFQAMDALPATSDKTWKQLLPDPRRDPAAAPAVVQQFGPALALLHEVAHQPRIDWGVNLSLGVETPIPTLAPTITLAAGGTCRAQWRLMQGDIDGAQADLEDVLLFSQLVRQPPLLICDLVGTTLRMLPFRAVARQFASVDRAAAGKLAPLLKKTLPAPPLAETFRCETATLADWLDAELGKVKGDPKAFDAWRTQREEGWSKTTPDPVIVRRLGKLTTPEEFIAAGVRLRKDMDAMVHVADGPRDLFLETQARLVKAARAEPDGVLSAQMLEEARNAREVRDGATATEAMVLAALAFRLEGPAGLKSIQDPFGQGPFECVVPEDHVGFQLRSVLLKGGTAVTVGFGTSVNTAVK